MKSTNTLSEHLRIFTEYCLKVDSIKEAYNQAVKNIGKYNYECKNFEEYNKLTTEFFALSSNL